MREVRGEREDAAAERDETEQQWIGLFDPSSCVSE